MKRIDPLTTSNAKDAARAVVVIGPPLSMVGGMAGVVDQVVSCDFGGRYRTVAFSPTFAPGTTEPLIRRIWRHLRHLRALNTVIRQNRAAIVHLHTCSGFSFFRSILDMMIARRRGCRTILHIHGAAFDEFHAGSGPLARRLIAWSLAGADRVIALSECWRQKLRPMSPGARLCVVENAVAAPKSVTSNSHDGPCRFLLLARMDEWKGIDDLISACDQLRTEGILLELVLAGPPGTAGDATVLERKIRERQLDSTIRYVGPVHGEDKSNLLRRADVYVQPSHNEGMPLSLLEAASHGLAIVATQVGAVPEVIADQREGMLVPPHEPASLASAMRRLIIDVEHRRSLGQAARQLALTRFGLDRFQRDLVELYDDVSAAPPRRRRTKRPRPDQRRVSKESDSCATPAPSPPVPQ